MASFLKKIEFSYLSKCNLDITLRQLCNKVVRKQKFSEGRSYRGSCSLKKIVYPILFDWGMLS